MSEQANSHSSTHLANTAIESAQQQASGQIGALDIDIKYDARQSVDSVDSGASPVKEPPLYFLSVNYYSAALLSDLMHTLEANQGIVIVNNSPTDRTVHGLAGQTYAGGEITVLDALHNEGFGAGCNLGLQWIYARSPNALVWLMHPSTYLMPNAVSAIRQYFRQQVQKQDIAILGTPILDADGQVWFGSGHFNRWTGRVASSTKKSQTIIDRPVPTGWVNDCSTVLNLDKLGHCPQFDDTYFLYYEDCDLCERYRKKGYIVAIAPIPLVVHATSRITSRRTNHSLSAKYVHATFSKLTFLRRHATPLALGLNLVYLLAQSMFLRLIKPSAARGRWIGIQHFLQGFRRHPVAAASRHQNE